MKEITDNVYRVLHVIETESTFDVLAQIIIKKNNNAEKANEVNASGLQQDPIQRRRSEV